MDALKLLREGDAGAAAPKKEKFIIRLNDRIVPVGVREIAYFYSESKNSFLVTLGDLSYVIDDSLDAVENQLDPGAFFRISRSCIISSNAIESVSKLFGGRMKISLVKGVGSRTDLTVSRARVVPFMNWLER
jgi:DNA-binding LytR/AlgR family response regulator